jgi:hypothetical protein
MALLMARISGSESTRDTALAAVCAAPAHAAPAASAGIRFLDLADRRREPLPEERHADKKGQQR